MFSSWRMTSRLSMIWLATNGMSSLRLIQLCAVELIVNFGRLMETAGGVRMVGRFEDGRSPFIVVVVTITVVGRVFGVISPFRDLLAIIPRAIFVSRGRRIKWLMTIPIPTFKFPNLSFLLSLSLSHSVIPSPSFLVLLFEHPLAEKHRQLPSSTSSPQPPPAPSQIVPHPLHPVSHILHLHLQLMLLPPFPYSSYASY